VKWPGAAAVVVSTVHTGKGKGKWPAPELDGRTVARISAFLREGERISDEFIVTISDNSGEEALITATIDIIGVNDAPELAPLDFTFSQNDVSGLLGLLDGAFDAEDDPLSISFFSQIDGPNVFGDFGPAAVRYDGFASFAGLEPTPIGDLNGDGFQDFFLGAGYSSGTEGIYLQGGRVILGGAANRANADLADGTFDGVVDLARANLPGVLAVEPEQGTYALGFEVAGAGDLNGDGIDDFLVSDPSFSDGGGAVHVLAGAAALAAAIVVGPRPGRFSDAGGRPMQTTAVPLSLIGSGLFTVFVVASLAGFSGNVASLEGVISLSTRSANSLLAAFCGGFIALFLTKMVYQRAGLVTGMTGLIAGLVSIAADPLHPAFWQAAMIGAVGGVIVTVAPPFLERLRIDDAGFVVPAHFLCGLWGVAIVPWTNSDAWFPGQLIGAAMLAGFGFIMSLLWWAALRYTAGVRHIGLDERADGNG
jgi:hypothetical protein